MKIKILKKVPVRHLAPLCAGLLGASLQVAHAEALNNSGINALGELFFDASNFDWSHAQADSVALWLARVDGQFYGLNFTELDRLGLASPGINERLVYADQHSWDLNSLYGPKGQYNFGEDGMTCGPSGSGYATGGGGVADVSGCIGTIMPGLGNVLQITTISNTFDRPTSQFQRDIRRFAANSIKQGMTGGGSAADHYAFDGRFGVYFSGGGSFGSLDGKLNPGLGAANLNDPNNYARIGFNNYNQTGTGAVDYRFSDWAVAGFMFNYTGTQTSMMLNAGQLLADSYRFMPFASFIPFDNAYVDVMAGYGYQTYDADRQGALANYSSDQALASIDLGYTLPLGAFELTGFAGGSYIGTDVSGWRESGSGVTVMPYHVTSWTSTVGTQFAYAISSSVGVVQPILRVEWVHAYNTQEQVNIVNPSGGLQPLPSVLGISDWGNFTAGVQTVLPQGMMAFLNYQGQVMQGGQNNGVLGGLRLEF